MNTKPSKRLIAYIIDLVIIIIAVVLLNMVFDSSKTTILNQQMNDIHEQMLHHQINFTEYINTSAAISQELDQANIFLNLSNLVFIFIFFVILPYFNQGATIGQRIMHLHIEDFEENEITIYQLIYRSLLLYGVPFLGIMVIFVYLLPSPFYFYIISILGIIQILLVIISGFMVLYRKDHFGLQDLISKTKVVPENKEVK